MKVRRSFLVLTTVILAFLALSVISETFAETAEIISADWQQVNSDGFGDSNNDSGIPFTYKGDLYASTYNTSSGAQILKYTGSITWTDVITNGFGNTQNFWVSSLGVFSDNLYVATQNDAQGTELWHSSDGLSWDQVVSGGFGDVNNRYVHDFIIYDGYFYAATRNDSGGQVWRSTNGSAWYQVNLTGFGTGNIGIWSLAIFQDDLYAGIGIGVGGGGIWRTSNGTDWTQVVAGGFGDTGNWTLGYDMTVFNNALYASTYNPTTGVEIWRSYNGENWLQVNDDGFGNPNNSGVRAFYVANGVLYAGVRNHVEGASVWTTKEGTIWTQDSTSGFGDSGNMAVLDLTAHNGVLYAGLQNDTDGGEVWAKAIPPMLVGLVPDETGVNNMVSLNWLSYQGLLRAENELGVVGTVYTPTDSTEYAAKLQACVDDGNDLCISVGFQMGPATSSIAEGNPGTAEFAIVDYIYDGYPDSNNLRGMWFAYDEMGYLAGTLAGLMTQSNIIGDIGGPQFVPSVVDLVEGYRNGAQCANRDVNVLREYAPTFGDPVLGAMIAQEMIGQGADVVFAAAGATGFGAVITTTQSDVWGIGVDVDFYLSVFNNGAEDGSDKLLSSAMKRLDNAVFDTISDVKSGAFSSGTVIYDLAVGGVGLAPFHEADPFVSQGVRDDIDQIRQGIIQGTISTGDSCRYQVYLSFLHK